MADVFLGDLNKIVHCSLVSQILNNNDKRHNLGHGGGVDLTAARLTGNDFARGNVNQNRIGRADALDRFCVGSVIGHIDRNFIFERIVSVVAAETA